MSTALRSFGLLDVLSSTPAGSSAARLGSMPVCAASLRNLARKAGSPVKVMNKRSKRTMPDWAWVLIVFVGYIVLMRWVLPSLGVQT